MLQRLQNKIKRNNLIMFTNNIKMPEHIFNWRNVHVIIHIDGHELAKWLYLYIRLPAKFMLSDVRCLS